MRKSVTIPGILPESTLLVDPGMTKLENHGALPNIEFRQNYAFADIR